MNSIKRMLNLRGWQKVDLSTMHSDWNSQKQITSQLVSMINNDPEIIAEQTIAPSVNNIQWVSVKLSDDWSSLDLNIRYMLDVSYRVEKDNCNTPASMKINIR